MTAPSIRSVVSSSEGSDTTTHTITYPATIEAGDTILAICTVDGGSTALTWPGGWTEVLAVSSAANRLEVRVQKAGGSEDSTTFDVTSDSSQQSASRVWVFQDAADPTVTAPEASTTAEGTSTAPDAPSVTPTGGPKDFLYLAFHSTSRGTDDTTGFPTGYSVGTGFDVAGSTGGVHLGYALKSTTASSSDNPSAFTTSASRNWVAAVVAIHPAGGGASAIPVIMHPRVIFRR